MPHVTPNNQGPIGRVSLATALWPTRYFGLIRQLAQRDVAARYRGSILGMVWVVVTPLAMLAAYTLVFHGIFNARWASGTGGGAEFALNLYAGLIVYLLFADCVGRAPRLVLDQPNLVKKVIFPLEILAWTALSAAAFHALVSLSVLTIVISVFQGKIAIGALALPLILLPMVPLLLGLSWFLSALGVYIRDIGQIVTLGLSLLLFLSPVFYPVSALPEHWQPWLILNPLTPTIEQVRQVLIVGRMPDWNLWLSGLAANLAIAYVGLRFFKRTRPGFADVV